MDIVDRIKKIVRREFHKGVKLIYKYEDTYYVVSDDFLNSTLLIIDLELDTSEGFVFINSDLGNKIIDDKNIIYEE